VLFQNWIKKYHRERGKKMLKTAIKKTAITKVLSCFLVFVILMSAVPVSVVAVNGSNNATDASSNETLLDDNNISFVSNRTGNTDIFVMGRISKLDNEPPFPKITAVEMDPPTCVKEGESATITVKFKNIGGPSSIGYISVSFPHDETIIDVSGTGDKEDIYPKGSDKLWGIHGKMESSKYPLAELTEFPWGKEQEKTLIITVKPNSGSDKIVFYVRAALKNDADGSYERDPTSSDYSDQQEWYVYRYSMDTCNVYPNLIITDIDPDENDKKIYYTIKNIGGITAGRSYSYLYIDDMSKHIAFDHVSYLGVNKERDLYFDYSYTCYGDSDTIKVCADGNGKITEADETDNCKTITKECDSHPESLIVDIHNPENDCSVVQSVSEIVKAKVTDNFGNPVSGLTVKATFTNSDAELTLYDDGAHGDGFANDGIYADRWVPTTVATGYTETACTIRVTATHSSLGSAYDEVSGVINSPKLIMIELTPSSHDFGEVQTTVSTAPFSFTLKNAGGGTATGEVSLTGSDKDQFIITSGKGSFSLNADQTKTIGVAFSPISAGRKSAILYAKCSNCNDVQSPLSGTSEEVGQPPLEPHINIENVLINYDSNDPLNIIGPLKIVAEEKTTIEVILDNTGTQNFNGGGAWLYWETEDTDTSPFTPVKEGSASSPDIYIKKIPPIPIGSSVTIQFEATFRVPSTPDQLNVFLKINSEVGEYQTNTFNKRPIFIWPSGSDYISCTLGVLNVASGGIVKACKDAGMIVSSINYVLFVADVNKLIEKAKAREFDREYWYVTSKCIISIGAAAKITGANVLSILLGSLEAAIPCANILNIYIEINQAFHTALYEVGFEVLTVIVGSPANVCIIDDNGNICGIFEDGTIIDQIPGSYISQFDHFKIVSVPGDGSKDEIKIEGTDNGEANVTLFKPKEMSATGVMISYDKVPVSPTTKIRIDMNPTSNPTYAMKIDNDGDGTIDETKEPDSIENIIADFPTLCTSPDPPTTNFGTVAKDQTRTRDFFITNCGSGTLTWSITCDQPSWLNVNPAIGSTTTLDVVTVTIDTHDLSPGTHTGYITLTSNGGEKTGTITVNVPPPAQEPKLCTSPDPPTTNFGTVPEDQTRTRDFFITNCGSDTLTWTITCDQPSWLNVNPAIGSTTTLDVVTVTIDTHDLSPGTHTGYITLTSNGGEKTGTITVEVPSKPSTPNVEFKGIVFLPCTYSDFTGQSIEVTNILSDPNGELAKCKYVCTCWTEDTLAQIDTVAQGDEVEVYGTLIGLADCTFRNIHTPYSKTEARIASTLHMANHTLS
jgi:hypothetical protein